MMDAPEPDYVTESEASAIADYLSKKYNLEGEPEAALEEAFEAGQESERRWQKSKVSTGEANGWISRASSATDDLADNPIALEISDSNFPGPTSVPQAEPPKNQMCECGCNQTAYEFANLSPYQHTADYCVCKVCAPKHPRHHAAQAEPKGETRDKT